MDSNCTFKTCRDGLQHGIYAVIDPFVRLLIRCGITPNAVTTIGLAGNIAAAALFAWAALTATAADPRYDLVTWAGACIIVFSLFDMLDGQVARIGGMASTFGALYDSVLDRYCELLTVGSIAFYLVEAGYPAGALIAFRLGDGKLCESPRRRPGHRVQGGLHAASRARGSHLGGRPRHRHRGA